MSQIYDIANDYVERYAALNPLSATSIGVPGYDDKMSDFSPQGAEANADLKRQTVAALNAATIEGERDRIARDAMLDDLQTDLDTHDAGEHLRSLRVLGSAFQGIRQVFDLMSRDTEEDWRNIASRLALVQQGMESYRASLQEGVRQSKTSSRRQAAGCADSGSSVDGLGRFAIVLPRVAGFLRRFRRGVRRAETGYYCRRRFRRKRIRGYGTLPD